MKKTILSMAVAFGLISVAQADGLSYVNGGVQAGTAVIYGLGTATGGYEAGAQTYSYNGDTQVDTSGGTGSIVIGAFGSADGYAQSGSVATQDNISANVNSGAISGVQVGVINGFAAGGSSAYAGGSATQY